MTLTPFTVYLIMQADSVRVGLLAASFASFAVYAIGAIIVRVLWANGRDALGYSSENMQARGKEQCAHWEAQAKKWTVARPVSLLVFSCILVALLPSTRTLAVTYIAPAIANSQMVQKDFPELYDLAINKLKEQLAPATEKK